MTPIDTPYYSNGMDHLGNLIEQVLIACRPVGYFLSELKEKGANHFQKTYQNPILILKEFPQAQSRDFEFVLRTTTTKVTEKKSKTKWLQQFAIPLIKSKRNAYQSKITVGRTKNNDVIIRSAEISKVHAIFSFDSDNHYQLSDIGSSNGTFLNGERLEPNKVKSVKSGDLIRFSNFIFEYLEVEAFMEFLFSLSTEESVNRGS